MMSFPEANQLATELAAANPTYTCRVLPDNTVACTFNLMFTRAIALGCDRHSWKRRFCFEDRDLAIQRFIELKSENDEPQGYVARRPQHG